MSPETVFSTSAPQKEGVRIVPVGTKDDKVALGSYSGPLKKLLEQLSAKGTFKGAPRSSWLSLATGELKDTSTSSILFVGVGSLPSNEDALNEEVRRAGGVAARSLDGSMEKTAWLDASAFPKWSASTLACFAEGAALAHYSFNEYLRKPRPQPFEHLTLVSPKGNAAAVKKELARTDALVAGTCFARDLGNHPANIATPENIAARISEMAKKNGMSCTVFDEKRIQKEGLNLVWTVGKGGGNKPRFIVLEYNKTKKGPHLCFVGKGMAFDAGGISIKPAQGMEEMKFDMCGAAAVAGAALSVALMELPCRLSVVIPTAENMLGELACRPGDIEKSHGGLTVEILNTDAEGRLILADAVSYAQKNLKPDMIVDVATLTGACVIALGNSHTGLLGNSKNLVEKILKAAEAAGEGVWELPIHPFAEEEMKGTTSDLRNIGKTKGAGTAKGAAFIKAFVEKDMPWAHLDIAGTAWNVPEIPYNSKSGGTGIMARTLATLAENWKK